MWVRSAAMLIVLSAGAAGGCGGSGSPLSPSGNVSLVTDLTVVGSPVLTVGLNGYRFTAFAQTAIGFSDVTTSATWTSSNTQVASFTSAGTVNVSRVGSFTVTAVYAGKTATLVVTVQ